MAKAGMRELMDAMADQISAAVDALTPDNIYVQVEPRMVINPTPPSIDIYPGAVGRDQQTAAFGDDGGYLFTVRARVSTADNEAGQDLLLRFMDDTDDMCIGLALADEPTLGGYASSLDIRDVTGYLPYDSIGNEGALLGFQFTAVVLPAES